MKSKQYYWERAEEMRRYAGASSNATMREHCLQAAKAFEELAAHSPDEPSPILSNGRQRPMTSE